MPACTLTFKSACRSHGCSRRARAVISGGFYSNRPLPRIQLPNRRRAGRSHCGDLAAGMHCRRRTLPAEPGAGCPQRWYHVPRSWILSTCSHKSSTNTRPPSELSCHSPAKCWRGSWWRPGLRTVSWPASTRTGRPKRRPQPGSCCLDELRAYRPPHKSN